MSCSSHAGSKESSKKRSETPPIMFAPSPSRLKTSPLECARRAPWPLAPKPTLPLAPWRGGGERPLPMGDSVKHEPPGVAGVKEPRSAAELAVDDASGAPIGPPIRVGGVEGLGGRSAPSSVPSLSSSPSFSPPFLPPLVSPGVCSAMASVSSTSCVGMQLLFDCVSGCGGGILLSGLTGSCGCDCDNNKPCGDGLEERMPEARLLGRVRARNPTGRMLSTVSPLPVLLALVLSRSWSPLRRKLLLLLLLWFASGSREVPLSCTGENGVGLAPAERRPPAARLDGRLLLLLLALKPLEDSKRQAPSASDVKLRAESSSDHPEW